jgi:hypothetical protein
LVLRVDNIDGRKEEIVEKFIAQSLGRFEKHPSNLSLKWLSFLADRMNKKGLVVFELLDLQYDWNRWNKRQVFIADFLRALVEGMVGAMVVGLFGTFWYVSLTLGLIVGLSIWLIMGLFGAMLGYEYEISTVEYVRFSFRKTAMYCIYDFRRILVTGLIGGLAAGLIGGLVEGLIGGLILALVVWLYGAWFDQLNSSLSYLKLNHPHQRFNLSMKVFYFSILQHWHLRHLLYKKDLLPLHLIHFLKEATRHNILESNGGSWRFRHRVLQDYFAAYWEEHYAADDEGMPIKEDATPA